MDYRNLVRSRGESPVWRIKASQKLYGYQQTISNKANIVGAGAGDDDVPALIKKLDDVSDAARLEAAEDLGFIGPAAKKALPALGEKLTDKNALVRVNAATALARIDPAAGKRAVPVIVEALAEKDAAVRVAAVEALADIGPAAGQAVPTLMKLLADADGEVGWRAIEALGWMGPEAAPAVPALMDLLSKGQSDTLVIALKRIGPHAKAGVPALVAMVKRRDRNAADILSTIGPEAKEAVPALIELLKDKELYFTAMVAQALGFIGTPEATEAVVPYCVRILQSPVDASYYQHFAMVLGQMGPKAKAAIPALEAMRKDNNRWPYVEEPLRKIKQ
uniref:HEAT repeat domain-containing protein n=1 Tax=uncultured Acidobacteria bacterium A2 TaxID=1036852 RepID=F8TTF5_9BACT|nr:conserved exported hypothetical protein [uncultured Acidobacteria bacterium A2]